MKGISFENFHSYNDFNLIVQSREIEAPEVKTNYVDVEGSNGFLDFSECFGEVKFNKRKIKYRFISLAARSEFWSEFTKVQNVLHGKKFKIVDDEDPDYFYKGRCSIDKWTIDRVLGSFNVSVDCEPYKYHLYETIRTENILGERQLIFKNDRMSVAPVIRVSSPMTINFKNYTMNLSWQGSNQDFTSPNIIFTEGNNLMTVSGTGIITVRYQEGSL